MLLQSATVYPPLVSNGKPLMPSEVSLDNIFTCNVLLTVSFYYCI